MPPFNDLAFPIVETVTSIVCPGLAKGGKVVGEAKIDEKNSRIVLSLKPHLSPIKAAIIPLKRNNEEIVSKALDIKRLLQSLKLGRVLLDNSGNIGKSYRRHDEIGTPMCVTVDFQSLEDDTITVRDRDSMEQVRISYNEVSNYFQKNIS